MDEELKALVGKPVCVYHRRGWVAGTLGRSDVFEGRYFVVGSDAKFWFEHEELQHIRAYPDVEEMDISVREVTP